MSLTTDELRAIADGPTKFKVGDVVVHERTQGRYVIFDTSIDVDTLQLRYEYIQIGTGLKFSRLQPEMDDGRFEREP